MTLGTSSSPPASSNSTLTFEFSASRRAKTEPDEPDPQTTKSYWGCNAEVSRAWLLRTRSANSATTAECPIVAESGLLSAISTHLHSDLIKMRAVATREAGHAAEPRLQLHAGT